MRGNRICSQLHTVFTILLCAISVMNCHQLTPVQQLQKADEENKWVEEERQRAEEEKRMENCIKNIYVVEEQYINKPYKVIDIVSITEKNGYTQWMLNELKRSACKKRGEALIYPKIDVGPLRTTFTSKVIIWTTPENP